MHAADKNNTQTIESDDGTMSGKVPKNYAVVYDASDESMGIAAVGIADDGSSPSSTAESWCLVADTALMTGVHPSSAISDERWRAIISSGGSIHNKAAPNRLCCAYLCSA